MMRRFFAGTRPSARARALNGAQATIVRRRMWFMCDGWVTKEKKLGVNE
jgi:hypothetical protein